MFVTTKKSMLFLHLHILPQNPQNPQKFLAAQDILPRIARIRTD